MKKIQVGGLAVAVSDAGEGPPVVLLHGLACGKRMWFHQIRALRRRFREHCSWESAAPPLKDPNRIPDPSTLRRWFRSLDSSPAFSYLRRTLEAVEQWLDRGEQLAHGSLRLAWPTLFSFLRIFWPWPLRL